MSDDKKTPEEISDDDLDAAQGGYSVELTNATVGSIRTEQMSRGGVAEYDESGPGIVHRTAKTSLDQADRDGLDGMHIDPVIP